MRLHEKHWNLNSSMGMLNVNFHRFMELEGHASHMEIAEELGVSLGEVKMLKKKLNRA
ncbi:hypothetical protein ACUL41_08455 [Virgibacillus natechei]|uniref:hypothetical protein n=1 Tax=Virgibacillus sp. CBA3643 TaxID=2942278 RepID=UPI0035A3878B